MADASPTDIKISCIAAGFTLGFGYLTGWDAWKVTSSMRNPSRSLFVWMVWSELLVNAVMAVIAWLFLLGYIKSAFATYFSIVTLWVVQIQFILQIIINRIAIITTDKALLKKIRITTIVFITLINISVFCIFIPGHLGINETYVKVNNIWDKVTKVLIGANDAVLNYFFITQVKKRLIANGLQKYTKLADFNTRIALISVGMDFLIIGTMFLSNGAVFLQFHPVAYTVKLKIELSMTNLIRRISQEAVRELRLDDTDSFVRSRREFGGGDTIAEISAQKHGNDMEHALEDLGHIHQKREFTVEVSNAVEVPGAGNHLGRQSSASSKDESEYQHKTDAASDETPLHWRAC